MDFHAHTHACDSLCPRLRVCVCRLPAPSLPLLSLSFDFRVEQKATKLFEAPKGPERSKIYQALNPQKLYYESRREKAEAEEEKEVIVIGQRDFGFLKDAEGNLIEEDDDEEEEEEEDYDPENLVCPKEAMRLLCVCVCLGGGCSRRVMA